MRWQYENRFNLTHGVVFRCRSSNVLAFLFGWIYSAFCVLLLVFTPYMSTFIFLLSLTNKGKLYF